MILIVFLIAFIFISCAPQLTSIPTSERIYQNVVEVDLSSEDIYNKTLTWMAESFRSSKEVIEYKDIVEGKIIGNTIISVNFSEGIMPLYRDVRVTIIIEIKENKFRFTAKNFILDDMIFMNSHLPETPVEYKEQLEKISPIIETNLINNLKEYLLESSKPDEW